MRPVGGAPRGRHFGYQNTPPAHRLSAWMTPAASLGPPGGSHQVALPPQQVAGWPLSTCTLRCPPCSVSVLLSAKHFVCFPLKVYEVAALRPKPGVPEGGWRTGRDRPALTVPASLSPASAQPALCSRPSWPRSAATWPVATCIRGGRGPSGCGPGHEYLRPSVTVSPDLSSSAPVDMCLSPGLCLCLQ